MCISTDTVIALVQEQQSVSAAGRRKHITDGDRVEERLLKFYRKLPENISQGRKEYIENGIAAHCTFHINSLMMCEESKENKKKINDVR